MSELAKIKRDGVAIDAEENADGVMGVAAPILGPEGEAMAALSISGPLVRMQGVVDSMTKEVLRVSRQLSVALGYKPQAVTQPTPMLETFAEEITSTTIRHVVP